MTIILAALDWLISQIERWRFARADRAQAERVRAARHYLRHAMPRDGRRFDAQELALPTTCRMARPVQGQ